MSNRKKIVAGNWKMNPTLADGVRLASDLRERFNGSDAVEVVVCPAFTALGPVAKVLEGGAVGLGAQNAHFEAKGAFTGEISVPMLAEIGCGWVILGHSERRTLFGETSGLVNRKAKVVLDAGLTPIVCVGETLEEREAGTTEAVVREQIAGSLDGLAPRIADLVIAYEPVWAIGTGRTATPEQAQDVHAFIRRLLSEMSDAAMADRVRIQYGGSVKPDNARDLFGRQDIDGGLIGGASLAADSFLGIVEAAL